MPGEARDACRGTGAHESGVSACDLCYRGGRHSAAWRGPAQARGSFDSEGAPAKRMGLAPPPLSSARQW
jgi:hypothetical protein